MIKSIQLIVLAASILATTGCQSASHNNETSVSAASFSNCNDLPPVVVGEALRARLQQNGVVRADMTADQISEATNGYLLRLKSAHKRCSGRM